MLTAQGIEAASRALIKVFEELGLKPTESAIFWILGMVAGESDFGTAPDWTIPNKWNTEETNPGAPAGPSHNWGAVRTFRADQPFIWHPDADVNGVLGKGPGPEGTYKFARYPSALDAARGLVKNALLNPGPPASALRSPGPHNPGGAERLKTIFTTPGYTALDMAEAMYDKGYFEGNYGSRETRIKNYAALITRGANRLRAIAGAPPEPNVSPVPKGILDTSSGTIPWGTILLMTAVGAAGVYALSRKGYRLPAIGKLRFT